MCLASKLKHGRDLLNINSGLMTVILPNLTYIEYEDKR